MKYLFTFLLLTLALTSCTQTPPEVVSDLPSTPIQATETIEWDVPVWDEYRINKEDSTLTQQLSDGSTKTTALNFDWENYGFRINNYGVLFWQQGPLTELPGSSHPFTYFAGAQPEFQFYDFETETFTQLPFVDLKIGEEIFEAPHASYASSSEKKLLIEIVEYDINDPGFEEYFGPSAVTNTYGLVYNISTNQFEEGDPLTTYLETAGEEDTLSEHFTWDSLAKTVVSGHVGEGCGHFPTLTFVDLDAKVKEVVGGEGSFAFEKKQCNPVHGVSSDEKWFTLSGENSSGGYDIYLFDRKGEVVANKTVELDEELRSLWSVEKWNTSQSLPTLLMRDGTVVDFTQTLP